MNTEVERQIGNNHNNLKSVNVFFSPQTNRNIYKSENKHAFTREANEVTNNYSPFVIKKSPNLLNSNSSQKTKNFSEINTVQNHKVYTPSPGNIFKERLSDRFIPMNKGTNLLEKFELAKNVNGREPITEQDKEIHQHSSNLNGNSTYFNLLESNFFNKNTDHLINELNSKPNKVSKDTMTPVKSKIFSFRTEQKKKTNGMFAFTGQLNFETENESTGNILRKINNRPYKVIEAPGLMDDFYLNLVDWSSKNELAVGLYNSVYLWCANKTQCVKLFNYEEDRDKYVSSVIWNPNGNEVAVGNSEGTLEIWDVNQKKLLRILEGHDARIGVVAWNYTNPFVISTGSKDYSIINRDLRANNPIISKLQGHKQEVCGLKWSFDGTQLASGGNDNKLMVWTQNSIAPLMKCSHHTAAVKAIAWSPHQNNLLCSGGGTADRCIRFWNTSTLNQINYVDTGSQVCNLVFSKTVNELVSTHGYSLNQIITWKLPTMTKLATLTGHTYRVLYLSLSPDGQNIVTGAGDQTLRFWNIFPPMKSNEGSLLFPSHSDLR